MKKKEPILISVTYQVGSSFYTGLVVEEDKKKEVNDVGLKLADTLQNTSCGANCRCVNGFKERFISWGGFNKWVRTNEPC